MKRIKAPSILDNKLLALDSTYPITGTFLEKYNYIFSLAEKEKTSLQKNELSILINEQNRLLPLAQAEGSNKSERFIQYIFSLYPYNKND